MSETHITPVNLSAHPAKLAFDKHSPVGSINLSDTERVASVVGGGALVIEGLRRGSSASLVLAGLGGYLLYRGATGHCAVYEALNVENTNEGIRVQKTMTINRPANELYDFWRNLENLPQFMQHVRSVKVLDGNRSHWVANAPVGTTVEWDAEIAKDIPNQMIAWRSLEGADIENSGVVRFAPATGGRGTEVRVFAVYNPPAGALGALVAKLFSEEPTWQIQEDLRHFKNLMETGEVSTIDGQSDGTKTAPAARATYVNRVRKPQQIVDEAMEDTFPASDPPAWTTSGVSASDGVVSR